MIQPNEMKLDLPINLSSGTATTSEVWEMLMASRDGNLTRLQQLTSECPDLVFCKYNYTPPIHIAVREGHLHLVNYLLQQGALEPDYKTYPFLDTLLTIAQERNHQEVILLLQHYLQDSSQFKFSKNWNGVIHFSRTDLQQTFENAVDKRDITAVGQLLQDHPALALDETYFWGEGILSVPAKDGDLALLDLLMRYGARVPDILKWAQFYYFKQDESAVFLLENGMNPNVTSWHQVTLLHDMAQKGDIPKATIRLKYGADINALEEEYQSTPLGLAARWGRDEMVEFLLKQGADPNQSGAPWATPLAWAKKKGYAHIERILS